MTNNGSLIKLYIIKNITIRRDATILDGQNCNSQLPVHNSTQLFTG